MTEPNFANRTLYHGDNLNFLRGMNSGTVHLIATDPPFNKSRDFHATPDSLASGASFQDRWSWRDDLHDDWLIEIQRDYPEVWSVITAAKQVYGDDMAAFLCFMGVRLVEMRRVLRDDGSIYLHCDSTASHYLKLLMDAVFETRGFNNEITWKRTSAHADSRQGSRHYGRVHDTILFYTRGNSFTWNQQYMPYEEEYVNRYYKYFDEDGRRYWLDNLQGPGGATKGNPEYEVMGITRYWRYSQKRMQELIDAGRVVQTSPGSVPKYKRYLDEMPGRPLQDIWDDIRGLGGLGGKVKERTGYPTQKPLALYERIIKVSSNPGDIVLDPFCGCAATPIAAERLGRRWVGMDLWSGAYQRVLERLEQDGLAVPEANAQPGQQILTLANVHYSTQPPVRTDNGESIIPPLPTPTRRNKERHPPPRTQHGRLIADIGPFCQGCGRDYGFDPRVLEVDHIRPKSDGGSDAYDNLTLLCPPCNKEKRDWYTLTRLQQLNRENGHLLPENERNIRHGRAGRPTRRPRRR